MGSSGSRDEELFALPTQQVVSVAGGSSSRSAAAVSMARHEEIHKTKIPLVWSKSSFEVQRAEGDASRTLWELSAEFTAEVDCELSANFHCRSTMEHRVMHFSPADNHAPPALSQKFPPGKHTFRLSGNSAIDLKRWPLEVFWRYRVVDVFPIVLSLSAGNVQSVVKLGLQVPGRGAAPGAAQLACHVVKQVVVVDGTAYPMQEIFGLADLKQEDHDESAVGEPCVICLTDPRNTAVLPCRHLCVCEDCSQRLSVEAAARNGHCPICRGNISGMQVFKVDN